MGQALGEAEIRWVVEAIGRRLLVVCDHEVDWTRLRVTKKGTAGQDETPTPAAP